MFTVLRFISTRAGSEAAESLRAAVLAPLRGLVPSSVVEDLEQQLAEMGAGRSQCAIDLGEGGDWPRLARQITAWLRSLAPVLRSARSHAVECQVDVAVAPEDASADALYLELEMPRPLLEALLVLDVGFAVTFYGLAETLSPRASDELLKAYSEWLAKGRPGAADEPAV